MSISRRSVHILQKHAVESYANKISCPIRMLCVCVSVCCMYAMCIWWPCNQTMVCIYCASFLLLPSHPRRFSRHKAYAQQLETLVNLCCVFIFVVSVCLFGVFVSMHSGFRRFSFAHYGNFSLFFHRLSLKNQIEVFVWQNAFAMPFKTCIHTHTHSTLTPVHSLIVSKSAIWECCVSANEWTWLFWPCLHSMYNRSPT